VYDRFRIVSLPCTDAEHEPDYHAGHKADFAEAPENSPAATCLLFKKPGKIS
jgi:hypothetical protein